MDFLTISNILHFAVLLILVLLFGCLWEARTRPDRVDNFIDGTRPEIKRGEPTEEADAK